MHGTKKGGKIMNQVKLLLTTLLVVPFLVFVGVPQGHADPEVLGLNGHYHDVGDPNDPNDDVGIGASVGECDVCHDFASGHYDCSDAGCHDGISYPPPTGAQPDPHGDPNDPNSPVVPINLRWVRPDIDYPTVDPNTPVRFMAFSGTVDSLADGDDNNLDGPCEVCHTCSNDPNDLGYHCVNPNSPPNGDGVDHEDTADCRDCHPHFADGIVDYFEPGDVSCDSSHGIHLKRFENDPDCDRNPGAGIEDCDVCHYRKPTGSLDYKNFGTAGLPLNATDVCDDCHSEGGAFHGVDDLVIGAKPNWPSGVYERAGSIWLIKSGKEDWCLTCHDDVASFITSDQSGHVPSPPGNVYAPNVAGNNAQTYGFKVSGHGQFSEIKCTTCHDLTYSHISVHFDGDEWRSRTYSASADNYQAGYRLRIGMTIPRVGGPVQSAFSLCFDTCHSYSDIISTDTYQDPTTNFRDPGVTVGMTYHYLHLNTSGGYTLTWDSDVDGDPIPDSAASCTTCHQVHGSPTAAMTRHGELIGHSDGLDFRWYEGDGTTETTTLVDSRYGEWMGGGAPGSFDNNGVCIGCHEAAKARYHRVPIGAPNVTIRNVKTTDWSNNKKDVFNPNDNIRYHVAFSIAGEDSYFVKMGTDSKAQNVNGNPWSTPLKKNGTLSQGDYSWKWSTTIPSNASPGSDAKVKMVINMFYTPGGARLARDSETKYFEIGP